MELVVVTERRLLACAAAQAALVEAEARYRAAQQLKGKRN